MRFTKGNFLATAAECMVVPICADGHAGRGLAAAVFARLPAARSSHAAACDAGALQLGCAHLARIDAATIALVAMRQSGEESTTPQWIERGLQSLTEFSCGCARNFDGARRTSRCRSEGNDALDRYGSAVSSPSPLTKYPAMAHVPSGCGIA